MSTLEDLDDLEHENRDKKQDQGDDGKKPSGDGDAEMEDAEKKDDEEELIDEEILHSSTADIVKRRRMLENEMRIMKSEFQRLTHEQSTMREKVKDNQEKIENNRYRSIHLPSGYLLSSKTAVAARGARKTQSIESSPFCLLTSLL
jgi:26S proteasome regulatory subunit T5